MRTFAQKIMHNLRNSTVVALLLLLFLACTTRQQEPVSPPWGDESDPLLDSDVFDLEQIEAAGEMIILTLSGPDTYYDYHGRQLGANYILAQQFADSLGVRLRVDVCRDTVELLNRFAQGDGDLIAIPMPRHLVDTTVNNPIPVDAANPWLVSRQKPQLTEVLRSWYRPGRLDDARKQEALLLSKRSVRRRVFSPMLNRNGGIISHYDALFVKYSQPLRWDWRLMAAQCYQESTFDPKATSWAGARGLMQIMPSTADHLGLPRDKMYDAESSIAAASKYIGELEGKFTDIADRGERTKFVLASYNDGYHHIRDAMALAQRDGRQHHHWDDVAVYVLRLSQPQYYQDPIVKHGYMRGAETVDYVQKIHERWRSYRGVPTRPQGFHNIPQKSTKGGGNKYQL